MSPIKRLGGRDAQRGTEAEYLSPGRFDGKIAVVTGAGSGIGRPRPGASPPRGRRSPAWTWRGQRQGDRRRHRGRGGNRPECRLPLRRHE